MSSGTADPLGLEAFDPQAHPHRRYNALTGEWMAVSPHRTQRPWQGAREADASDARPPYDAGCYLCPGNTRAGGAVNPPYTGTFVFTNDFAALMPHTPSGEPTGPELARLQPVRGECRVVCFSPRHDLTLAEMEVADISRVVDVWAEQAADLGARYRWVQLFENKGATMGCSNPHPHGQVWSCGFLPRIAVQEDEAQREYSQRRGTLLLADYAAFELADGTRVVEHNANWLAVVPFWAVWPFELLLIPRRPVTALPDLDAPQRAALADVLKRVLTRYDNLFSTSFPYTMGWHAAPTGPEPGDRSHWQLHAHFYPPLLRSATVRKFMVGYEMLAEPQRDITAECAAQRLRDLSTVHYRAQG